MIIRIEYSQDQGRLHILRRNNVEENTHSYRTVARNVDDDVCANFLNMICDKYPVLVPLWEHNVNDKPPVSTPPTAYFPITLPRLPLLQKTGYHESIEVSGNVCQSR